MKTIYKELELFPDSYDYGLNDVEVKKLNPFLSPTVISRLEKYTRFKDLGIFSDGENAEVVLLDDVFPLIIENGWRYVNTYWKGDGTSRSHKVLTFIKQI